MLHRYQNVVTSQQGALVSTPRPPAQPQLAAQIIWIISYKVILIIVALRWLREKTDRKSKCKWALTSGPLPLYGLKYFLTMSSQKECTKFSWKCSNNVIMRESKAELFTWRLQRRPRHLRQHSEDFREERRIFASRGLQSWDNYQPRECRARPRSGQPPDVCLVWSFLLLYCDKICSVTSCPKCYYLSPISDEGLKIDFSDSDYLKYFVVPSHSFSEIMYFPEYLLSYNFSSSQHSHFNE